RGRGRSPAPCPPSYIRPPRRRLYDLPSFRQVFEAAQVLLDALLRVLEDPGRDLAQPPARRVVLHVDFDTGPAIADPLEPDLSRGPDVAGRAPRDATVLLVRRRLRVPLDEAAERGLDLPVRRP